MLKQLRERTKTILWIVVIAFVVSVFAYWGMGVRTSDTRTRGDRDVVGKVNGKPVSRQAYANTWNELLEQIRMQKGDDYRMSDAEQRMLADQAWELTIQKMLIADEIEKRGIAVTDEELVTYLRRYPPPIVQQIFTSEDGTFDYQAYLAALSDPSRDWTRLEQWARAEIPQRKLENSLAAQIHVTDHEVLDRFKQETIKVRSRYVAVPMQAEDPPYEPTDQEIAGLYDRIKEDYKEFEKRRINLIEIPKTPTEADEQDVRDRLLEIKDEIASGEDFAEAAKNYSDDYMSADSGGDLGFIGRGVMVPEFEEAAFALDVGTVSEPVRTEYGYHLIKVEERTTEDGAEKIRVRHILMKVEIGYDTLDSLRTVIEEVVESIREDGFERAAEAHGLRILAPPPFARGSFIQDLGYQPRITNFAFNHKPGAISSAIETEDAVFFAQLLEAIPERYRPLEEIRDQLVARIRRERTEAQAREIAEAIRRQAKTSGDLISAAAERGLEVVETPLIARNESVPGIGVNTAFSHAGAILPVGELSAPVKGQDVFYLIVVTERTDVDMEEFAKRRTEILNQLRNEMASHFIAGWYDEIRQSATVMDFREGTLD